jgi:hypothetical protein
MTERKVKASTFYVHDRLHMSCGSRFPQWRIARKSMFSAPCSRHRHATRKPPRLTVTFFPFDTWPPPERPRRVARSPAGQPKIFNFHFNIITSQLSAPFRGARYVIPSHRDGPTYDNGVTTMKLRSRYHDHTVSILINESSAHMWAWRSECESDCGIGGAILVEGDTIIIYKSI